MCIFVCMSVCLYALQAKYYRIAAKRVLELKLGQNARGTNLQRIPTFQKFFLTFWKFRFFRCCLRRILQEWQVKNRYFRC